MTVHASGINVSTEEMKCLYAWIYAVMTNITLWDGL